MTEGKAELAEEARKIVDMGVELGADQSEAVAYSEWLSTTRFNNYIHQNTATKNHGVYVTVVVNRNQLGSASISSNSPSDVEGGLRRAIKMAKIAGADPNFKSLPDPQEVRPLSNLYRRRTARLPAAEKAEKVGVILDSGLDYDDRITSVAGYFVNGSRTIALANSSGVDVVSSFSVADLQINAISKDAGSSGYGYSAKSSRDVSTFDYEGLATEAAENSVSSLNPVTLQPGEYEVVLKPHAVGTLLDRMGDGFSAESHRDGRSFLSGRLGEKVFDDKLTLIDDGRDLSTLTAFPFDGEGVPKRRLPLIRDGVAESLCYDTYQANIDGIESTGHRPHKIDRMDGQTFKSPIPMNQIVVTGTSSMEDLISDVSRGLLVTRFHYVTVMDEREAILSGMTRDGTWLIEDGEIRHPVKNLRFTDSMLKAFSRVDAIGDGSTVEMRCREYTGLLGSLTTPSMKLRSLRFTGLTE